MGILRWICCSLFLATLVGECFASHYRGGIIMIQPVDPHSTNKEMEVYMRQSWRRDSAEGGFCDQTVVASGTLIPTGFLSCIGCTDPFALSSDYYCTDFSLTDNWSFGERRENYSFSQFDDIITISYSSCCWVAPYHSTWNTATTMSLAPRNDTGRINSTPRALTALNLRLLAGCNHTITIPVTDPDFDDVRCRWANGFNECGDACNKFPGAVLDSYSCTISYDAINGPGLFIGAIMIEDFLPGSNTSISSVALQFMVEVFTSLENCSSVPEFIPPTLEAGSCIAIPPNTVYTGQLFVYSGYVGAQVVEINTVGPSGLTNSPIYPASDPDVFYVNITWQPDASQLGEIHAVCYIAINSLGLSSEQRCIQLSAGDYIPNILQSSLTPANNYIIPSGNVVLHLEFNKPIQRTKNDAKMLIKDYVTGTVLYEINFLDSNEILIYNDSHIQITPNFQFPGCSQFSIEFEMGVVIGYGCNLESDPVTDRDFWTFSTICPTTTTTTTESTNIVSTTTNNSTSPCDPCPCDEDDHYLCDDDDSPCKEDPCDKHHKRKGKRHPASIHIENRPIMKGRRNIVNQKIVL